MKWIKRLFLAALVLGALGGGAVYWLMFMPNTPGYDGYRGAILPPGSSFETVTDSLESAGLLGSRTSFEWAATLTGWRRQLKPGYYRFEAGANNLALLDKIRKGRQDPVRVTVPPGTRPAVLAAILRRDLNADSADVHDAFSDQEFARELGTDTTHLFGYMRPNSFDIYWTTDGRGAIRRLKQEWDRFWTDEMEAKAAAMNLSKEDVLTVASIVEWEARKDDEKPTIAGVYLNRLRIGMKLDADPTVQYALMKQDGGRMRRLFYADYRTPSPYNTYLRPGLPPGPITNPSEASIRAVVNPAQHEYLYFVADGTGGHVFSRTLAEHNRAAAAYRRMIREQRAEDPGSL